MRIHHLRRYTATIIVYAILVILVLITGFASDVFLTGYNLGNLFLNATSVGLLCIGQTFTIVSGGIDLSVGSLVSLTTCLTAGIIDGQESLVLPVVAMVFTIALLIGFCNGLLVTKTGVHPIIVTLGMMAALQGVALIYTKTPTGAVPDYFAFFAWERVAFIPVPCFILGIAAVAGIIVLKLTRFGRYVYATGGNAEIARLSGIHTDRIRIVTYMICSFCAALAGLYLVSRMGMGDPRLGEPFLFDSIVPVLLGGTSFSGGKGGIVGTLGGVFILTILNNTMNIFDVSAYWQYIVAGAIIIVAVAFYGRSRA